MKASTPDDTASQQHERMVRQIVGSGSGSGSVHAAPITQTLRRQPDRLVIEISDPDPNPPVLTDAGPDDESGCGLMLVQALAKEWSYYFTPSGGKTIYCVLPIPADAGIARQTRRLP
jgi:hypothetical protein